jgi:hypothetical protein
VSAISVGFGFVEMETAEDAKRGHRAREQHWT